jgi:hypothetical protein
MATLNLQVASSVDDCFVYWNGSSWALITNNAYQDAGYAYSSTHKMGGGMRFQNVTIPGGATITAAYLTLRAAGNRANTAVNSRIKGEDVDDAAAFSNYSDYSGRARTAASMDWDNIPAWTAETEYNSPDIKTIIQAIINRPGWASGNDLVIFWDDHDDRSTHANQTERYAYSYDGSATKAPKLAITYTTGEEKTSGDNGLGAEAISLRETNTVETGNGIEQSLAVAALLANDGGIGSETGGLLKDLFGQDVGGGYDKIKVLTNKAGYDLRLHSHRGRVGIPHKEVRL